MNIQISRGGLLQALQSVIGVVERRQSLPILGNVLLSVEDDLLRVCATDLEIQIECSVQVQNLSPGKITAPARKLYDICRGLPEGADLKLQVEDGRLSLRSGRSRFVLSTLDADEFPSLNDGRETSEVRLSNEILKNLIQRTQFAMAQQDVRYYLNGLLLEFKPGRLRAVATDGHRLALSEHELEHGLETDSQLILPRKTVLELMRLLENSENEAVLKLSAGQLQVELEQLRITSKLVDGRFPDYERVIPTGADRQVNADRLRVRAALSRAAILSNEKFRGVRLRMENGEMHIQTQNPEQEEAQEDLEIDYNGEPLEIGFNVNYLLDALDAIDDEHFRMELRGPDSSGLLFGPTQPQNRFVVMPMRL